MGGKIDKVIVERLPDFRLFNTAKLGSFSLTSPNIRYIAIEDVVDYEDKQDTSGVHYRDFLVDRDAHFPRKNAPALDISYPYYAKSGSLPSGIYVDLRRAYQQITCAIGMEVWYKEGKAYGIGSTVPDTQLFEIDKISRGLLVTGHYEQARYTLWKDNDLRTVTFKNVYYAPYLQFAIWRILHAIMTKVKPFVYYVHTDGMIINHRMLTRVDKILSRYHLKYAIKDYGETTIKTTGTYKIG
jgi:hypothetical protein